jgi:probable phosphoglycerate mutase
LEGKEPTTECYDQFRTITAQWKNGHYDVAIEGGESPQQMFERQKIALNTLMSDPHETVLVCMHGRALRSFLCLLTDTPLCDMDQFPHENTGLYILEHQTNAKFEITTFNYTDHLN